MIPMSISGVSTWMGTIGSVFAAFGALLAFGTATLALADALLQGTYHIFWANNKKKKKRTHNID